MADDHIIETRGLTKEFKGFVAVDEVDLKVRRGAIHALIGPNGAGKTTVFNLLTKFLEPTRGQILYNGRDITREQAGRRSRARAWCARSRSRRSSRISRCSRTCASRCSAGSAPRSTSGARRRASTVLNERARELLEAVGLAGFEDGTAAELPYGRKRALEIATTLALEPEADAARRADRRAWATRTSAASPQLIRKVAAGPHGADGRAQHVGGRRSLGHASPCCSAAACSPRAATTRSRAIPRCARPTWGPAMPEPAGGAREVLRLEGLHAFYGESHILHGVEFGVREGEVVTLLGRNGAGQDHDAASRSWASSSSARARSASTATS